MLNPGGCGITSMARGLQTGHGLAQVSIPWAKQMKITSVRTVVVNAEMHNWIFVKIETDGGWYGLATYDHVSVAMIRCWAALGNPMTQIELGSFLELLRID